MIQDRFGGIHATANAVAMTAYESAVESVLRHRSPAAALSYALDGDPDFVSAHILRGFCNVLLARAETIAEARLDLESARISSGKRDVCTREALLVAALKEACAGEFLQAISLLEDNARERPHDLIAIKLAHALQFLAGQGKRMATFTGSLLEHWSEPRNGYGYFLGCHAFSLEEIGHFRDAERFAQAAMHHQPDNLWAMHALAHVYEMNGRDREGVIWLQSAREVWGCAGSFSYHLAWHLALFNFNLNRFDRALAIYDSDVRPCRSEEFRDIANAVSLLWRFRQEGVDVDERFEELAEIARRRIQDRSLVFATLHHLLSLLAVGDFASAEHMADSMQGKCEEDTGHQSCVALRAGAPLAKLLLGYFRDNKTAEARLAGDLALRLKDLGGSNAQRDVFLRSLAQIAAETGDMSSVDLVLACRHEFKREDRFTRNLELACMQKDTARERIA